MPRILVIEDEPDLLALIARRLRKSDYEVETALGGEEGLRACLLSPPDLILLDLFMPQMDGFEVCRRIRKEHRCQNVPIVVLTGATDLDSAKRVVQLGADGYLVKPFDPEQMLATIRAALERRPFSLRDTLPARSSQLPQTHPVRGTPRGLSPGEVEQLEEWMMAQVGSQISHELRTSLTAIQESIALLRENDTRHLPTLSDEEEKKLLDIAQRNIERLNRFVVELLESQNKS